MLNYVWTALIFLGIAAAVSVDITESAYNRFSNNVPLQTKITLLGEIELGEKVPAQISFEKSSLSKHFNQIIENDLEVKTDLIFSDSTNGVAIIKVNPAMPKVLLDMAKVNGKEDDLMINISSFASTGENLYTAKLNFEEITFRKIKEVTNSAISFAETAVKIALGLIGIMAMWLGIMKIAEAAGVINVLARGLRPVTKFLFPDVPHDHPAIGSIIMNVSANFLGLSNAATPFGLKAMEELDKLNENKGTATNAMCTFLAINTAGITMIPATAIAIRAAAGSAQPAIIIGTSLFASCCATIAGITAVKLFESLSSGKKTDGSSFSFAPLFKILKFVVPVVLAALTLYFTGVLSYISVDFVKKTIELFSTIAIPLIIALFVGAGLYKKVKVYETFVEGAKEGFNIAVKIIPYLVAMLVAIGIFRAGGAMDWLIYAFTPLTDLIGMPAEALPMAIMRPLSGSGSLAIMAEIISTHGPDSFIGILVSTFFGATETTFYVLAVYFGSVNIKNTRHALPAGLIADVAGILAAVFIVKILFT